MTIYTLYVKIHTKTRLRYLGQTSKDPITYLGSGIDWRHHLSKHGNNIETIIIAQSPNKQIINDLGRHYSLVWNVTNGMDDFGYKIWANRIPETGGGSCNLDAAKKISEKLKGRKKPPRNKDHTEKIASALRGKSNLKTAAGLRKWYDSDPDRSNTIEKQSNSLKEWYRKNPESSSKKAFKIWDVRYRKQYNEYKKVIELIKLGHGVKTIKKETGMYLTQTSIENLRSGKHRIYELFPDLNNILFL